MASIETVSLSPARATTARGAFAAMAMFVDFSAALLTALAASEIYHRAIYDATQGNSRLIEVGAFAGILFVAINFFQNQYTVTNYLSVRRHFLNVAVRWSLTFPLLVTLGFLLKASDIYSRGAVVLFFVAGVPALVAARVLVNRTLMRGIATGAVVSHRVFLVGCRDDIASFLASQNAARFGVQIAGVAELSALDEPARGGHASLQAEILQAVDRVRLLQPDAIVVAAPWSRMEIIRESLRNFMTVPVDFYVASSDLLEWSRDVEVSRIGPVALFRMARRPLSMAETLLKRAFDFAASAVLLILLAPFLALVSLAIMFDSKGPVFFLQRRYGFNQNVFRIIKFRTMHTMDDGDVIVQAREGDARITRIGHYLRRWNIDELPQLINVLKGDMSLVGPRPHALPHNYAHERAIALYARRHNVLPGITGWAQVNGFRGETDTNEKMEHRVAHDLYYIDNWSIWLDMLVLFLTVFSRKAYRNAR